MIYIDAATMNDYEQNYQAILAFIYKIFQLSINFLPHNPLCLEQDREREKPQVLTINCHKV